VVQEASRLVKSASQARNLGKDTTVWCAETTQIKKLLPEGMAAEPDKRTEAQVLTIVGH
jgi:hypothetical protein